MMSFWMCRLQPPLPLLWMRVFRSPTAPRIWTLALAKMTRQLRRIFRLIPLRINRWKPLRAPKVRLMSQRMTTLLLLPKKRHRTRTTRLPLSLRCFPMGTPQTTRQWTTCLHRLILRWMRLTANLQSMHRWKSSAKKKIFLEAMSARLFPTCSAWKTIWNRKSLQKRMQAHSRLHLSLRIFRLASTRMRSPMRNLYLAHRLLQKTSRRASMTPSVISLAKTNFPKNFRRQLLLPRTSLLKACRLVSMSLPKKVACLKSPLHLIRLHRKLPQLTSRRALMMPLAISLVKMNFPKKNRRMLNLPKSLPLLRVPLTLPNLPPT